jgi:hypothetical protein
MFCSLTRMSERKPRLDWIRKVLVDLDRYEGAGAESRVFASRIIAFAPRTVPGDQQSPPRRLKAGDEGGVLLCPSWQLMRLTATQKS